MLSEEEIRKLKINVFNQCDDETTRLVAEMLKHTEQLESDKQKLIEWLEERRKANQEDYDETLYNAHIEETNELKGKILEDNYILKILKGEKQWVKQMNILIFTKKN